MDSIADIDTYLSFMELPPVVKILDIGAHKGRFTEAVRQRMEGHSFMFEPTPERFAELQQKFTNDSVYNWAVSDKEGIQQFVLYGGQNEIEQLNRFTNAKQVHPINTLIDVRVISLDSIHEHYLNHLTFNICKIDTEGQELNVFKGAEKMLKNKDLKNIIFEVGGTYTDLGYTAGDVIAYLNSFGYKVYDFDGEWKELTSDFNDHSLRDLFAK